MDWFLLSLVFVIFISSFNYLSKKILTTEEVDPRLYGGLMNLGVGILVLPVAVFSGFTFQLNWKSFELLILIGCIITGAASLYYTGLKRVDLSESVILEGAGVFTSVLFGSWFFREPITPLKGISVFLIFGSIWFVSGLGGKFRLSKFELSILFSTVLYSLGAMIDKYAISYFNPLTYLSLGFLSVGIVMLLVNFYRIRKNAAMFTVKFWKSLLIICLCIAIAYAALYYAYAVGEVSRVLVVTQSQVVLTAFAGIYFLGEHAGLKRKLLALILLAAGLFLIRL